MTTATQTVAKALETGLASERIQAAKAQGAIAREEWLSFAERIGEMLVRGINGDTRMGQSAMLQLAFRRQSREGR
jgi:hypothetical protein